MFSWNIQVLKLKKAKNFVIGQFEFCNLIEVTVKESPKQSVCNL